MGARGPEPVQPCGTYAAWQRHYRRGEKPCDACTDANRRRTAERFGLRAGAQSFDARPVRNGVPAIAAYSYRARTYPWAQRALARAEATWGALDTEQEAS